VSGPLPMSTFRERITGEIAAHARVDPTTVRPDAHLVIELGLSSIDLLTVLAYAEQHYGAKFPDELLGTLTTLEKIEAAVLAHPVAASAEDRT
jgi:acyl carrier protein